jgi:galacturonosyltransferase
MRILILDNYDVGFYKFRLELVENLLNKKHEVYISLPYGDYIPKLKALGCKYTEVQIDRRATNPVTDFKLFKKYLGIIRKIRPDTVLTYTIKPNVYGGIACRLLKVPYMANITDSGLLLKTRGF